MTPRPTFSSPTTSQQADTSRDGAEKKIAEIFIDQQLDLLKIFPQIFSK